MNLLADEGVDLQIVERLRQDGHEVSYVAEMAPGVTDETVLNLAQSDSLTLLTADKDFGELVYRQGLIASGVVLIRLSGLSPKRKALLVSTVFSERASEMTHGTFVVISPGQVRIRKEPE